MENRIEKLQEDYLRFCLNLLRKIPEDAIDYSLYAVYVNAMHKELKDGIATYFQNYKIEEIKEIEYEIEKIRLRLESKLGN